ncbi:MAG: replication protein [Elusimicrobiota bacterium]
MANPQAEHGHIDIANEIAEQLALIVVSPAEWSILWVIWRKTWGWVDGHTNKKKKFDYISLSQFMDMTGLTRSQVCKALKKLLLKNIIIKHGNKYGFQKDYEKWVVSKRTPAVSKLTTGSVEIDNQVVSKLTTGSVKIDTYKRNIYKRNCTKETIQKNVRTKSANEGSFDFNTYLDSLLTSSRRDLQIIGLYWQYKDFKFYNPKQASAALKRELRPAKPIEGYSDERLKEVMCWLNEHTTFKWTLETVHKYIDEDLSKISEHYNFKTRENPDKTSPEPYYEDLTAELEKNRARLRMLKKEREEDEQRNKTN